jgi:hypothetical protein
MSRYTATGYLSPRNKNPNGIEANARDDNTIPPTEAFPLSNPIKIEIYPNSANTEVIKIINQISSFRRTSLSNPFSYSNRASRIRIGNPSPKCKVKNRYGPPIKGIRYLDSIEVIAKSEIEASAVTTYNSSNSSPPEVSPQIQSLVSYK